MTSKKEGKEFLMKGYAYPLRACIVVVVGCLIVLLVLAFLLYLIIHAP